MKREAYLLIGSNEGDRRAHLTQAIQLIDELTGSIHLQSGLYETAPWGKTDQSAFLNMALGVYTRLEPLGLLHIIKHIEKEVGRLKTEKWGPRIIDIDILLYGDEIVELPDLTIPHPYLPQRRFALVPLVEIAGAKIHPSFHITIKKMMDECPDHSEVTLVY